MCEFCTIIPDDSKWWERAEWIGWLVEYFQHILEPTEQYHRHYDPDPAKISVFNAFAKKDISVLKSIRLFLLPYLRTRPSKFVLPVSSNMFDSSGRRHTSRLSNRRNPSPTPPPQLR